MSEQERRRGNRVPFVTDVVYSSEGASFKRRSTDLSREGIFIEDSLPPADGEIVTVEFEIEGHPVVATGRVVGSQPPIGFGVSLGGISDEDQEAVARLVSGRA